MADLTVSANVDSLLSSANTAAMLAVLGVTALGTTTPAAGVATFLATPSSANLKASVTDETGSGALVFANTPSLVTPDIGAATGASLAATVSVSAPTFTGTGTTPTALCLPAGTGSIPALPANSAGFAAPSSGGTSYLIKMPATISAGIPKLAAAATADGVNESAMTVVAAPTGTIVGTSDTQTLTNKRNSPRITAIGSGATPTVNTDNCDCVNITGLAVDITSMTTNLSGTPAEFEQLEYRITGTAARAITWGASFVAGPTALPTTTVTTKALHAWFEWDTVLAKWVCMSTGSDA